jgi:hypothetical protein
MTVEEEIDPRYEGCEKLSGGGRICVFKDFAQALERRDRLFDFLCPLLIGTIESPLSILQLGTALISLGSELLQLLIECTGQARRGGEYAFRAVINPTVKFCHPLSDSIRIQGLGL